MKQAIPQERRRARIRAKVQGTAERPRLAVYLSIRHTSAQLINDEAGRTIVSAGESAADTGTKAERAASVGKRLAAEAKKAGVSRVVFDRAGHPFRGRTRALAEAAREGGLEF